MSDDLEAGLDASGVGEISNVPEVDAAVLGDTATEKDYSNEDPAKYSEDQILDWAADQQKKEDQQKQLAPEEPKPTEAKPPQTTPEQTQPQAIKEHEVTAALKSLATTHPAAAKQIRDSYYAAQAYRDLFPIQDARAIRGMFTNVQEAKQAQTAQADLMALDYALVNDPSGLIQHISSRSPQAIQALASSFGPALFDVSSDLYRQTVAEPAVRTYMDFLSNYAAQTQNQEGVLAVQILKELEKQYWQGEQGKQGSGGMDRALQERLARAEQIEESQRVERATNFQNGVTAGYIDKVSEELSRMIDNTGSSLSDEAKNQVVTEVANELGAIIRSDPYLTRRLMLEIRNGERFQGHRDQLVGYLFDRVKGLMGPMTRDAIEKLTKSVVNTGQVVNTPVQQRTRVPVGAPPGTARKVAKDFNALPRNELMKMSMDDIISAAAE